MKILKIFLILLLFCLGVSLGFGYEYLQLKRTRTEMGEEIAKLKRRASQLKKKYGEKKALSAQLMRTKALIEGQKRTLMKEVEKLNKEKEALFKDSTVLGKQLRNEIIALERKNEKQKERYAKLKENREQLKKKYIQEVRAGKEREAEIGKLTSENRGLESALKGVNKNLDRCENNNAKLCILTEELIEKYKNKGAMTSFMQNEPLTQIKKVELEHLIQEYEDRIDKNRLSEREKE